ncbi:hypothetical protein FGKAn22_14140 [Ferrigenium kumadai]|uniref:BIG2 domain-containing protein n=1 Tax=Ferrigenium kumadai TaxID=1682490 RepID=A0AAN1SZX2_9PROT|nr:Ig-like domain-containing protein [Ferrigenium kumadai]BBI99721.1 hypothetical protein FGKAn22_14140 [Ferrigenium kumadai]
MNFPLSNQGHRDLFAYLAAVFVVLLILVHPGDVPPLNVSSSLLQIKVGNTASINVSDASGDVSARSSDSNIATVSYDHGAAFIKGLSAGSVTITIWDKESSQRVAVAVMPSVGGEAVTSAPGVPAT